VPRVLERLDEETTHVVVILGEQYPRHGECQTPSPRLRIPVTGLTPNAVKNA
jgi:hypothetical protein